MEPTGYQEFTDLKVWQEARSFKQFIIGVRKLLPPEEKYCLNDQLKRSSRSIATQIAEGHGRYTYKDQLHFCVISWGSLSETLSHLYDALDEHYITQDVFDNGHKHYKSVQRLLNGYMTFLRKQIKNGQ
jgi:four helix bundle protein